MSKRYIVEMEYTAYETYYLDAENEQDAKDIITGGEAEPESYDTGDFNFTSIKELDIKNE